MTKDTLLKTISRKLHTLHIRHSLLENKISREHSRPMPDAFMIQKYKRLKLKLKDEIALMHQRIKDAAKENRGAYRDHIAG